MALTADLRAAVRALVSERGFAAIAVSTLSASLALAVVILTVVNAYTLRSLPYPAADRLYRVDYAMPGQLPRGLEGLDWPALDDVVEVSIAWDLDVFSLLGQQYPESMPGAWITPGYVSGWRSKSTSGR